MNENNRMGTHKSVAEPFHVDSTGRLTMRVLGSHLLSCAEFRVMERGLGIATLNEDNYTWVLSRLAVELNEVLYQHEDFSIRTWVESVYCLFTNCSFAIIDKDGEEIGYARSVWVIISLDTHRPADLSVLHGGSIVDYVCDKPCPVGKPSRIKVVSTEPASSPNAKYSNTDINGHINSIRYIEHILDLLLIELRKESRVRRFKMTYTTEGYYGDEPTFYKDYAGDDAYDIEVKKNGSGVVCRSKVIFVKK